MRYFVLYIQIRFVSTEKTTRIASRASCYVYCSAATGYDIEACFLFVAITLENHTSE